MTGAQLFFHRFHFCRFTVFLVVTENDSFERSPTAITADQLSLSALSFSSAIAWNAAFLMPNFIQSKISVMSCILLSQMGESSRGYYSLDKWNIQTSCRTASRSFCFLFNSVKTHTTSRKRKEKKSRAKKSNPAWDLGNKIIANRSVWYEKLKHGQKHQ